MRKRVNNYKKQIYGKVSLLELNKKAIFLKLFINELFRFALLKCLFQKQSDFLKIPKDFCRPHFSSLIFQTLF